MALGRAQSLSRACIRSHFRSVFSMKAWRKRKRNYLRGMCAIATQRITANRSILRSDTNNPISNRWSTFKDATTRYPFKNRPNIHFFETNCQNCSCNFIRNAADFDRFTFSLWCTKLYLRLTGRRDYLAHHNCDRLHSFLFGNNDPGFPLVL